MRGLQTGLGFQRGDARFLLTPDNLAQRTTFTRATPGHRWTAGGVLVSEAANVPRVDYDPATGALRGVLFEGAATQRLNKSEDFSGIVSSGTDGTWVRQASTTVATGIADPKGGTAAVRLTLPANGMVYQRLAQTAGASAVFDAFARLPAGSSAQGIRLTTTNTAAYNTGLSLYVPLTTSWQRLPALIGALIASGTQVDVQISTVDVAGTNDSRCNGQVDIYGPYLRNGTMQDSYVASPAGSARAADACSAPVSSDPAAGLTALFRTRWPTIPSTYGACWQWTNAAIDRFLMLATDTTANLRLYRNTAGSIVASAQLAAIATNADHRIALGLGGGIARVCVNGQTPIDVAVGSFDTALTVRRIGCGSPVGGELNGWIIPNLNGVTEVPYLMSATEMQAMTA